MINTLTKIYGVLGFPLGHSLSPVVHNAALAHFAHNAAYFAFATEDLGGAISGVKALGIAGLSVTIPHKVTGLKMMDELDRAAAEVGAINTVVNRDGILFGTNTDWPAVAEALAEVVTLRGKRAVVLGAGGAARAAAYGLVHSGAEVMIVSRSKDRAAWAARGLGAGHGRWDEAAGLEAEVIVNATPVGMFPNVYDTPIKAAGLSPETVVLDMVYNPLTTRLVQEARRRGCAVVSGLEVFLRQAALQFELWTSLDPPVEIMRQAALEALGEKPTEQ